MELNLGVGMAADGESSLRIGDYIFFVNIFPTNVEISSHNKLLFCSLHGELNLITNGVLSSAANLSLPLYQFPSPQVTPISAIITH